MTNVLKFQSKPEESDIQKGDAILVIRPGGDLKTITVGFDPEVVEGMKDKDVESMNQQEIDMTEQGQALYLLSMAYESEPIMDFLRRLASTPGENTLDKMLSCSTVH